jgi:hypothetical protein
MGQRPIWQASFLTTCHIKFEVEPPSERLALLTAEFTANKIQAFSCLLF